MSERHSRASSLSLVSGLGTSSVSGTSESGHVNIDELDDEQLKSVIFKLRDSLKRSRMETEIFESYYERLMSGNLSIVNTSSTQSRKTSATQSSNMTPESDSIIQTPSLLDGQRGRLSRKKSSSRTSLASRHKSMKLSIEQRCGIARKELSGIELELKEDRALSQQKIHHGNFIIGERSQRIHELFKIIERLEKVLRSNPLDQTVRDPDELLNPKNKLRKILEHQLNYENQFLAKMKTKNIVLKSKIVQTNCHIVKRQAIVDEIGTVDHAQLCIENNKYLKDLDDMEMELTRCREQLRKLRLQMDKYIAVHTSYVDKRKDIIKSNQVLRGTINDLSNFLKLKKKENNKVISEINHLLKKKDGTEPSNVDDIVLRYLIIEKNKKCRSTLLRKKNLRKLESMPRRRTKSSEPSPALYRGLTYDLYFCMPDS